MGVTFRDMDSIELLRFAERGITDCKDWLCYAWLEQVRHVLAEHDKQTAREMKGAEEWKEWKSS